MSTLCQVMEESFVPSFEGIDPPLIDPMMVEHFKKQLSASTKPPVIAPNPPQGPTVPSLEGLAVDDLLKLVTQLCEIDPSLSEQIISAFNLHETAAASHTPPRTAPEPPIPDTNAILKTLNQSLLLQDFSSLPTSLCEQLDTSIVSSEYNDDTPTDPLQAMKSNLFVMNKQTNNFVPISQRENFRRPKYTRKNFSPEQIEGLESAFSRHRFVRKDLRKQLAKQLSLSERSISYWFQNKRARSKPPITMSSEAALRNKELEEQARAMSAES